jgi:hypothetical protein
MAPSAGNSKQIVSVLEDLIQLCNDGAHGYKTAAEDVDNLEYKTLFNAYSQQRTQFSAELEREANLLGRDPDAGESLLGTLHRGWINIKSAFHQRGHCRHPGRVPAGRQGRPRRVRKVAAAVTAPSTWNPS